MIVRTVTVTGFAGAEVLVSVDGAPGRVPASDVSHRRVADPSTVLGVGDVREAEVIGSVRGEMLMSLRACEDPELRAFLLGLRRDDVVSGTVESVHNFGVFVHLDGEPGGGPFGFIRVPEITWRHIDHPADELTAGERVTAEVLDVDTRRGQAAISTKALQPDPMRAFVDRVGEVVTGRVIRVVPFGAFVDLGDGWAGLLLEPVEEGAEVAVRITEVSLVHRRIALALP